MFEDFQSLYNRFEEAGADNPLIETLKVFNFLYRGSLQKMNLDPQEGYQIDLDQVIQKRLEGIPIEYIFGKAHFMDNTFVCNNSTLIPTPETKLLVDTAVEVIKERQKENENQIIIDMGTGCGNIAVMLAQNTENTLIYGSDISPEAIEVAKENAVLHGFDDRIEFRCGDLFDPFMGSEFENNVDVIVCNPPYMPTGSVENLPSEIRDHEPKLALDAGPFGVDFYVRLLKDSLSLLRKGGHLVFEIGEGQNDIVNRLIRKNGGYFVNDVNYGGNVRFYLLKKC